MNKKISSALSLLLAVVIISGCTTEAAPVVEEIRRIPIELMSMKRDIVEHTYISVGEVIPNNQVDLYVSGNGFIESINAATGTYIEKDMLLIQLDDSDVDMTNYNATESQLRTVRDNLAASLTDLRSNYSRQETLFQEGIVTKVELDQVANQISNLEREYTNAKVSYSNQLTILSNGLDDGAESRRTYSPISGRVAAVYVNEGQAVSNQLALTIIDDSRLFISTYVAGDLKKALNVEDYVRVKLDGKDDLVEIGQIAEIKEIPDMSTKLFEIIIEIAGQDDYIIGDYAEIEFIVERYQAVLVPTQAIIRRGSSQFVYVYKDETLEQIQIDPGRTSGTWLEVKNVDLISEVVVRGQNQLSATTDFQIIE